ncbi:hypothetical protein [Paramagnetospirillum magnetotacticum]|nr:hypothetical protein [Paramagnetospirillum magnetotacticum]
MASTVKGGPKTGRPEDRARVKLFDHWGSSPSAAPDSAGGMD